MTDVDLSGFDEVLVTGNASVASRLAVPADWRAATLGRGPLDS